MEDDKWGGNCWWWGGGGGEGVDKEEGVADSVRVVDDDTFGDRLDFDPDVFPFDMEPVLDVFGFFWSCDRECDWATAIAAADIAAAWVKVEGFINQEKWEEGFWWMEEEEEEEDFE